MGNTRHCLEENKVSNFDGLKLLYVSTSKYEGDWQSILHSHPFSELFYVVRGSGSFVTEGTEFPVSKNDLVIINPHVQHTERSLQTTPLEYIVLGIDGLSFAFENNPMQSTVQTTFQNTMQENAIQKKAIQKNMMQKNAFQIASQGVYKYNMQNSYIYAYLNIMLEELSKKEENYEAVCQHLLEVIMLCMLRNDNLAIVQNSNALLNRECTQIKNYLDANYSENITLDMLASLSHMNKYYMVHAFTKYIGISPITYLLQKRIQEGKSLLGSTTYSISQISDMLGFSSQSYFSQAFKKATGKTPIQYRNERKQSR